MKHLLYNVSTALGLDRLFAFINRGRPIVLAFHGVTAKEPGSLYNYEGSHLYRPIFAGLMEHLASRYNVVSVEQLVDWLEGRAELPGRAVVLTFDDGYRNVITEAAPVLSGFGVPATVFVTADFVVKGNMLWPDRLLGALAVTGEKSVTVEPGTSAARYAIDGDGQKIRTLTKILAVCKSLPDKRRRDLVEHIVEQLGVNDDSIKDAIEDFAPLSERDLKDLEKYGISVGSHTRSHPILANFPAGKMKDELAGSRQIIERITNKPCVSFAYPNGGPGDFNDETRAAVMEAGYRCAVTTIKKRMTRDQDRFEIPRYILTHNRITKSEFSAEVSGYLTFLRGIQRISPRR